MVYDAAFYQRHKEKINARARARYHDPKWREKNYDRYAANRAAYNLKVRQSTFRTCKHCGSSFSLSTGQKKYCCLQCQESHHKLLTKQHRSKIEVLDRISKQTRERYKNNPNYRIRKVVDASIAACLRRNYGVKNGSVLDALPYSIDELRSHIESQFNQQNGFTWENYGKAWHIDHIIPCAVFNYKDINSPAFRDCWALSNLRPLAAIENIRKHAKYFPDYQI